MTWDTRVQFQVESYQTQKMVLDAALLNTQHYKVQMKSEVEQSRERSSALPHTCVVAIEKGAFWSPTLLLLACNLSLNSTTLKLCNPK